MTSDITFRLGTMEDHSAICRLIVQADRLHADILPDDFQLSGAPARPRELVAKHIENEDADYILAESAGKLVGFLNLKKMTHPPYPIFKPRDFAVIDNLVVDETCRRQGIGTALLGEAKRWAKKRGLEHVQLTVWSANATAIAFYETLGFQPLTQRMELKLG